MDENLMKLFSQQMAAQGGGASPDMNNMIMQVLQNSLQQKESLAGSDDQARANVLEKKLRQAKKINRSLRDQLEVASVFISQFADLVGACPRCLGQVPECEHCHGNGGPGSRLPDAQLVYWVEPALKRLNLVIGNEIVSPGDARNSSTTKLDSNTSIN